MLSKAVMSPNYDNNENLQTNISVINRRAGEKMGTTPLALKQSTMQAFQSFSNEIGVRQKTAAAGGNAVSTIDNSRGSNISGARKTTAQIPKRHGAAGQKLELQTQPTTMCSPQFEQTQTNLE